MTYSKRNPMNMLCFQQEIDMIRRSTESLDTVISANKDHIQRILLESVSLKKRAQELERDKSIVMRAEDTAVCEKIIAEKKLVEIGGHDSAIRSLKKTLDLSNHELEETTNELSHVRALINSTEKEITRLQLEVQCSTWSKVTPK